MSESGPAPSTQLLVKLGTMVGGAAVVSSDLIAPGLGTGINAIVGGIIGNFGTDVVNNLAGRSFPRKLSQGEPNHDLNKALARAIHRAPRERQRPASDVARRLRHSFRLA